MQPLLADPDVFKLYALAATVLTLQFIALALWTGTVRAMRKVFVNPEDAKLNSGVQGSEHPDVDRVKRAHINALENGLPFLVVGLLYVLTGGSHLGAEIYFATFVGARLLHSVFYLKSMQPFRTLSFGIGVAVIIGLAVHVIRAVV